MKDELADRGGAGAIIGARAAELVTALVLFAAGVVVVVDSVRIGRGWAPDGPEAGFYPFYVGLILCACSGYIAFAASRRGEGRGVFLRAAELRRVLTVLAPTAAYVGLCFWLGLYEASALFSIGFMRWVGRRSWLQAGLVGLLVSSCLFLLFERWFMVPLPKGPLEAWLGL
jgi:putative tricarboxylic transport membrane protein